jgi:hypothetical protein
MAEEKKTRKPREKMSVESKDKLMQDGLRLFSITDEEFKSFGDVKGLQLTAAVKKHLKQKFAEELKDYKGQEVSVIASGLIKKHQGKEVKPNPTRNRTTKPKTTKVETSSVSAPKVEEKKQPLVKEDSVEKRKKLEDQLKYIEDQLRDL